VAGEYELFMAFVRWNRASNQSQPYGMSSVGHNFERSFPSAKSEKKFLFAKYCKKLGRVGKGLGGESMFCQNFRAKEGYTNFPAESGAG